MTISALSSRYWPSGTCFTGLQAHASHSAASAVAIRVSMLRIIVTVGIFSLTDCKVSKLSPPVQVAFGCCQGGRLKYRALRIVGLKMKELNKYCKVVVNVIYPWYICMD